MYLDERKCIWEENLKEKKTRRERKRKGRDFVKERNGNEKEKVKQNVKKKKKYKGRWTKKENVCVKDEKAAENVKQKKTPEKTWDKRKCKIKIMEKIMKMKRTCHWKSTF